MGSPVIVRPGEADWVAMGPGVRRRVMTHTDDLMMVEVEFEDGARGRPHSHPHVQASYVARGSFEVTIDGVTETVHEGQSFIVPSGLQHGVNAVSAGTLIDCFTPAREDFLA